MLGSYASYESGRQARDDEWTAGPASTQPGHRYSHGSGGHYYYHGSSYRDGPYSSRGSGSSAHGTSRGGFGATGHAAGS